MKDQYNREIDYLRVSVTDRCNLRCVYCMPEEGVEPVAHEEILSYEEILRVCRCAAKLGFWRVKLTGGEPLVRRGVAGLAREIKAISGIRQVTMTTNGVLLGDYAEELAAAGLDAVNVSLDTLDPEAFHRITRRGELSRVLDSIDRALAAGLRVKLNCVPTRGNDEAERLAALAKDRPIDVRFIELMPVGEGDPSEGVPADEIRARLAAAYGPLTEYPGEWGNGPASYCDIPGFAGKIGFISAMSHRFCGGCNRVRLTATGFLKLCLHFDEGTDLRGLLRGGADDAALTEAVRAAVWGKPAHHLFGETAAHVEQRKMVQIGG